MKIRTIKHTLFTLALYSFASFAAPQAMAAAAPAPSYTVPETCDQDYYDVLRARSYVEGKRELEIAQRLIMKADSVLEYSCFNEDLIHVATEAGRFSEYGLQTGTRPPAPLFDGTDPPTRIYPNSLENAFSLAIYDSLVGFLDSFSHIYGGGSFAVAVNPLAGCNPMNVVWHASKCQNFDPGWWVRLEDLADTDIRVFPTACNESGRNTNISTALAAAFPAPALPAASGGIDDYRSFNALLTNCSAAPAIPTGITVRLNTGSTVDDAVCAVPGCYYDGSGCTN